MKAYFCIIALITVVVFTTSCSGKYDDAIKSYIENTENVTDVKITEVKEIKKITVGDSITYINLKAEQALNEEIQAAQDQISAYQEELVKANTGKSAKIIVEAYTTQIIKTQQIIDSLKGVRPEPTKIYESRKTDHVLAVVAECSYTINIPTEKKSLKSAGYFVLSADGKICYGTTQNPEMSIDM